MTVHSQEARKQRHRRVRMKVSGTAGRPRLNVFRSLKEIYAQVIDDQEGRTLVAASSIDKELAPAMAGKTKKEKAAVVGRTLAERAVSAGITEVVFDRGGYVYHGRVRALAEAARQGGLKF